MQPLVSVVMSVYNAEAFLHDAICSILNQSFQDFEFIIIDDCSTDNSRSIIQSFSDSRIICIENEVNIKLPASLNKGISIAKGNYIVRMDADDISFPKRIEKQVAFMQSHPHVAIAFCDMLYVKDQMIQPKLNTNDLSPDGIKTTLLFYNVVNHNCVIMRKELFETFQYNPIFTVTEDLALWIEISTVYQIHYMKENLMLYLIFDTPQSAEKLALQQKQEQLIKQPLIAKLTEENNQTFQELHAIISQKNKYVAANDLIHYMRYINTSNARSRLYKSSILKEVLIRIGLVISINHQYSILELGSVLFTFGLLPLIRFGVKALIFGIRDFIQMQLDIKKGMSLL